MRDIVDSMNSRGLLIAAGKPFRIVSLGTALPIIDSCLDFVAG